MSLTFDGLGHLQVEFYFCTWSIQKGNILPDILMRNKYCNLEDKKAQKLVSLSLYFVFTLPFINCVVQLK